MKWFVQFLAILMVFLPASSIAQLHIEHPTLPLGSPAPDFKLPAVDGKTYSLASFKNAPILVLVFTCNHCPTAQAYEDRIKKLVDDYGSKGMALEAIMPNDPKAVQLSELGYTDMGDTFEEMKIRAKEKSFNFPYLYDGETEAIAKAYGPIATPHVFIFDKDRKLRYQGRIDDVEKPSLTPKNLDARNAIEALLKNSEPPVASTKTFGCSIKWAEKEDLEKKNMEAWAKEPVKLETIDEAGMRDLVDNRSDKLRVINFWSSGNTQSKTEFKNFVTANRMYRARDFEWISVNIDGTAKKEDALNFLKQQQASAINYVFKSGNLAELASAFDPNWKGQVPYTLIVETGGKIVLAKQGAIDPFQLKKTIVENHMIGRYY